MGVGTKRGVVTRDQHVIYSSPFARITTSPDCIALDQGVQTSRTESGKANLAEGQEASQHVIQI